MITEINNKFVRIAEARNIILQKVKKKKIFQFKITKKHENFGRRTLRKIGLNSSKDWFVTLHIRQYGWRGETIKNTNEKHRTPNPGNYIPAINEITSKGGNVILVGNNNYNFPKIKNFFNYANSSIKSEIMDIYLAANSKFCIGNSSGFFTIAQYFGTPVLLTDGPSHTDYFTLHERDIYLPRIIFKKNIDQKKVKINLRMFDYPLNSLYSDNHFERLNLDFRENTPEEIRQAVLEMLNRSVNSSSLQNKFKRDLNKILKKNNLIAFADLPDYFLKKHYL